MPVRTVYIDTCTHAHTMVSSLTLRGHPSSSVTSCSGVRGHPALLCVFLSHLEAGVTLRAVRLAAHVRTGFTEIKRHTVLPILPSTRCVSSHPPSPRTHPSLSHTRSLSRYTHILHVLSWVRLKAVVVAFFLSWQPIPVVLSSVLRPWAAHEDCAGPTVHHFLLRWCVEGEHATCSA